MIELLLFLHILLFAFSFAFTAGIGILLDRVARSRDAKTIHTAFSAAKPLSTTGGIGWLLTALVGVGLAHAYGLELATPWLVYSYIAFAVLILTGFLLHSPWQAKVVAASASPGPGVGRPAQFAHPSHGFRRERREYLDPALSDDGQTRIRDPDKDPVAGRQLGGGVVPFPGPFSVPLLSASSAKASQFAANSR